MHVAPSISSPRSYRLVWRAAFAIAALQAVYAVGFIFKSSCVIGGKRYFCLFDDAMIALQYASNWVDGHGLVWNPGERVEGYTSLLWTTILAGCELLGLSESNTCLLVQLLGIAVLWGCLAATVLLLKSCRVLPIAAICALILVATYYNLAFFTLMGMETGLLTCLVTLGMAECVTCIRRRVGRFRAVIWFIPAVFVRLDASLILLCMVAYVIWWARTGRLRVAGGLLLALVLVIIHMIWRHHYCGEWMPNTYYLKLTGWPLGERLLTGFYQTLRSALCLGLPFAIALIGTLSKPKRWLKPLLACFLIAVAYQIWVGGDAWPLDRFLIPEVIALFILLARGIHRLIDLLVTRKTGATGWTVRLALAVICLAAANFPNWDHWLLLSPPQTTGVAWSRMQVLQGLLIRQVSDPDVRVGLLWAGSVPYFSRRAGVDFFGKCDAHIAHLPARLGVRRAGHNKWDNAYSIRTYKPEIVIPCPPDLAEDRAFRKTYKPLRYEVFGSHVTLLVHKDTQKVEVERGTPVKWRLIREIVKRKTGRR